MLRVQLACHLLVERSPKRQNRAKKCTRKLFFKAYDAVPPKNLQGKEEKVLIIYI